MQPKTLEILYLDDHLVAVYKPAGMLVHKTRLERSRVLTVAQRVRKHLKRPLFGVHRLDRPTAGVLLFALDSQSAAALARQFVGQQVDKRYLAVVRGYTDPMGTIGNPLKTWPKSERRSEEAKPAITHYRRMATIELDQPVGRYATSRYSLVQVKPETGRTHQIRRHFNRIAHPVWGDRIHGDNQHNHFLKQHYRCSRMFLAAMEIGFVHPVSGQKMVVSARLDKEYAWMLQQLGWHSHVPGHWLRDVPQADK